MLIFTLWTSGCAVRGDCNCSAALACLDSWKPCDWSGKRPTLGQTWTLAGGARKYFRMCGSRPACGGDAALNSRTVTCFKTFISWWCVQGQEGSEGALMSSIPALRFEVLHRSVGLVGDQDGDLLTVRSFGSGDDFILWGHKKKTTSWGANMKTRFLLEHLAVSYRWCRCQFSPSPGWRRTGTLLPSPQWGWRAAIWEERSRLPRRVHLQGSSWGRRWWSRAHPASCPFGRWREELWEEEWMVQGSGFWGQLPRFGFLRPSLPCVHLPT